MTALESETNTISTLAAENKKRLGNTDSALGFICVELDRLLEAKSRECCKVNYSESESGNFMYCAASGIAVNAIGFGGSGPGTCATTCGSLTPE